MSGLCRTRKRRRGAQSEVLDISRTAERGSVNTLVRFDDTQATWLEKTTDDGLESSEQTPRTNLYTTSGNAFSSGLESSFPPSSTLPTSSSWESRRAAKHPTFQMLSPSHPPSIPSEVLAARVARDRVVSLSPSTETLV